MLVLFDSFGMVEHLKDSTHIDGHTLDLVVSRATDDTIMSCKIGDFMSDHHSIDITISTARNCRLPLVSYGDRSFRVAVPREWNKLPLNKAIALC